MLFQLSFEGLCGRRESNPHRALLQTWRVFQFRHARSVAQQPHTDAILCGRGDSNSHDRVPVTSLSDWRVCQFRHARSGCVVGGPGRSRTAGLLCFTQALSQLSY